MAAVAAPPHGERDTNMGSGLATAPPVTSSGGRNGLSTHILKAPPAGGGWRLLLLVASVIALLVLAAGTFLAVQSMQGNRVPGAVPAALRSGGHVISPPVSSNGVLLARVPGNVVAVAMAGRTLVTGDGVSLQPISIRPGDTIVARSNSVLVDTSQTRASVRGIVATAPDPGGDVMTVQLDPSRTILVDLGGHTRINGLTSSPQSRLSIADADQVQITGILDKTFDEMTETSSVLVKS